MQTDTETASQTLNHLADDISQTSVDKGFWEGDEFSLPVIKLALIVDEAMEALQEYRADYGDKVDGHTHMTEEQETKFAEELADILIRTLDLAGYYELDIGDIVVEKIMKNASRPYKHGKRF